MDISPLKKNIQIEDTQTGAAASEATMQKVGGSVNFINARQHSEKNFVINGHYSGVPMPFLAFDGFEFFQYDAEIIDVWMYVQFAGSGGTTELDVKYATTPGGAFTSIFTTTPKIQAAAGNNVWVHVGSALANTTAPVLLHTLMNAGYALRCDLITAQSGAAVNGCGIVVHYRPR